MNATDVQRLRAQFPILARQVNRQPLVYLDNAATTQKPQQVLDAIVSYYRNSNANVHRAAHALADEATHQFELARETVARFIRARSSAEIVWTRGTTESINLVAHGLRDSLRAGDEILLTAMEHHSNIVPWQLAANATGAVIKVVPVSDQGELDVQQLEALISPRTKVLAFVHVSNALGTVNPAEELCALASRHGVISVVDGAQAVAHQAVDVQQIGCDFYAFSAHKMYGPTGIGVLYGRSERLAALPPYQGGGEMIREVTFERSTYNDPPLRFEAGTPHIEGTLGLAAAVEYLSELDRSAVAAHEEHLRAQCESALLQVEGLRIIGTARHKAPVVSFVMDGGHPHDIATLLDQQGIAVRAGHHCAMPLMQRLQLPGTVRASFALYNDHDDVERLVKAVQKCKRML